MRDFLSTVKDNRPIAENVYMITLTLPGRSREGTRRFRYESLYKNKNPCRDFRARLRLREPIAENVYMITLTLPGRTEEIHGGQFVNLATGDSSIICAVYLPILPIVSNKSFCISTHAARAAAA